jgi:hypothetical protein
LRLLRNGCRGPGHGDELVNPPHPICPKIVVALLLCRPCLRLPVGLPLSLQPAQPGAIVLKLPAFLVEPSTLPLSLARSDKSLSFRLCTLGLCSLTSLSGRTICFRLDVRERDRPPGKLPRKFVPVVFKRWHRQNPGP